MPLFHLVALFHPLVLRTTMLAQASGRLVDEVGVGAAILLTTLGMVMHWHLPRHRMSMEERVKDGDVTADEARLRIRFYARCAPLATLLGVTVLVYVLFHLTE